jgi:hypothetical protein
MKRKTLHERYHDLQDLLADPEMALVIEYLDSTADAIKVPESIFLSIPGRENLFTSEDSSSTKKVIHKRNSSFLWRFSLAFLVLFFLGGAAWGVFSILDRAFLSDAETARIIIDKYGQSLSISRSFDGFTVTIERIYADKDNIIIGYTVSGPPGRKFANFVLLGDYYPSQGSAPIATMPVLSDDKGHFYASSPLSWGAGIYNEHGGYILRYETGGLDETIDELNLRMEAKALQVDEIMPGSNEPQTRIIYHSFVYDFTVRITDPDK